MALSSRGFIAPVWHFAHRERVVLANLWLACDVHVGRYGEEAKIKKDVSELISTCATFLQDVEDLVTTYPAVKKAKQMMQLAYDSLVKGGSMSLAKAKPHVEKLRNATRDMNKNLKLLKV